MIILILFKFVQLKGDQLTHWDCSAAQREQNQPRSRSLPCLLTTFRNKTVELALELFFVVCRIATFRKICGFAVLLVGWSKKNYHSCTCFEKCVCSPRILSSPLNMAVATACLIPSSREEGHHDDINPESAVAGSTEPPMPEEKRRKESEEEKKARRK